MLASWQQLRALSLLPCPELRTHVALTSGLASPSQGFSRTWLAVHSYSTVPPTGRNAPAPAELHGRRTRMARFMSQVASVPSIHTCLYFTPRASAP